MNYEDLPQRWKLKIREYLAAQGMPHLKRFNAGSFPLNGVVKIRFPDASFVSFEYAMTIEAPEFKELGLFTEHCGYHLFPLHGTEVEFVETAWEES